MIQTTVDHVFNITAYGAVGDGVTDCTEAIQTALNEAGKVKGCVLVPPGDYVCGCVRVPRGVMLTGYHAWSYRHNGGSTLIMRSAEEPCLLDLSGAIGCTIKGICLDGRGLGETIHGMRITYPEYNGAGEEDTTTIEDCRVSHFSGDGIHLRHIWCFSIRHTQVAANHGNGIYVDGWDGFILDNWMSGNGGAGLYADICAASMTMTGNRVEWNRKGGFWFANANTLNITGNYFDRSCGPGLTVLPARNAVSDTITVTGNVFYRSGAHSENSPLDNAHIHMERCVNVVVTGNTFRSGMNDDGTGLRSPDFGIIVRHLRACIIRDNVMQCGMVKQAILDRGEHEGDVEIDHNVGTPSKEWPSLARED